MTLKNFKWIPTLIIEIALISPISTTKAQTTADDMLRRADDLAAQDHARVAHESNEKCENWLKALEKSMRENEENPYEDAKAYAGNLYREQLIEYKRICERDSAITSQNPEVNQTGTVKPKSFIQELLQKIAGLAFALGIPISMAFLFIKKIHNKPRRLSEYVTKNLTADEYIINEAKIDWHVCMPPCSSIAIGLILLFRDQEAQMFFGLILFLLGLLFFVGVFSDSLAEELIVTSKRIFAKKGSINAGIFELYLNKVESLIVKPNFFAGLLHYGTIVIVGTRGEKTVITSIDKPHELKHIALDAIDLAKKQNTL